MRPSAAPASDLDNLKYQIPAAVLAATFFALASYAPPRALVGGSAPAESRASG